MSNSMFKNVKSAYHEVIPDVIQTYIPDGLQHLVKGYSDYAKEVVIDRAIPNIDGLKPSQRRILYTMKFLEKVKDNTKCANIAGATLKLHPHGDASVYATMVRMVDKSEFMSVPFIIGKGSFGKVYDSDAPAASRYTECRLASIADELFGEMNGVDFIPSYDNERQEPILLPVSFPSILCNTTQGIAVGVASNIPSFNFNEVNEATIELIQTGDISGTLMPDFTTKGFYVQNDDELKKLMTVGKARLRLRGKWHVEGKTIVIEEIPYYTTTNQIKKDIEAVNIQGVSDVRDETDKHGLRLVIECSNKKIVDEVLTEVLKISTIQMNVSTNIVVIIDNKPKVIGIKELLRRWVDFRSTVIEKTLRKDLDKVIASIENYEVIVELLSNKANRDKFIELLMKSEHEASKFLRSLFPKIKSFDYVLSMSLKSLSNVNAKIKHLEGLKATKADIEHDLKDVKKVIVNQLKTLNSKYKFPRQTVVTDEDFVFEKDNIIVKAEPVPVVVMINGKFIKKMRKNVLTDGLEGTIKCMSNSVISFIDTKGRLLRLNLDNIDFVSEYDRGIYLPVYLEVDDDFEVVCYDLIEDKTIGYVYSNGFVSVVDYGEWVNAQRCTRITQNGVSTEAGLIIGEVNFDKAYMLLVTKQRKFGFVATNFKQKHRTARTRLVNVKEGDEITAVIPVNYDDILQLVTSPVKYMDKLTTLSKGDSFNAELFEELLNN